MKPEKALALVHRYAELNRSMKDISARIGQRLAQCNGYSGRRNDPHYSTGKIDSKGRELDVHLTNWYTPERGEYGTHEYHDIGLEEHGAECCHCYEAHLLIQQRKLIRKEFGNVKSQISRSLS